MITWVEKYFSDRQKQRTGLDEIAMWLNQMPGEVKHVSMAPIGPLVIVVVGYEEPELEYVFPNESASNISVAMGMAAIDSLVETLVDA